MLAELDEQILQLARDIDALPEYGSRPGRLWKRSRQGHDMQPRTEWLLESGTDAEFRQNFNCSKRSFRWLLDKLESYLRPKYKAGVPATPARVRMGGHVVGGSPWRELAPLMC